MLVGTDHAGGGRGQTCRTMTSLYKMGPYANIWAHTLRIRSDIGYKGSCVPKIGLGHHNIIKYLLDSGPEKFFQTTPII